MPAMTVLRRPSTLVVGAMFAVVFACRGVSAVQPSTTRADAVVSAHTSTSKVVVRTTNHAIKVAQAPVQLASTGPVAALTPSNRDAPVDVAGTLTFHPPAALTASERAPPAL